MSEGTPDRRRLARRRRDDNISFNELASMSYTSCGAVVLITVAVLAFLLGQALA